MSKKTLWVVAGVLVVVLAAVFLKNQGVSYSSLWPSSSAQPSVKATATPKKTVKATAAPAGSSYSELVAQYANARIQFDKNCQSQPVSATYKVGTKIMLDNRSGDARTIKVGSVAYSLPGYGYRIVTLTSPTLPQTLNLSCGSAVNVGQILLQANISN